MLTTISMIRVGKTYGNLMVDVKTGSEKLKDRARRIVAIVTGADPDEAGELLKRAKWNVKAAIVMKKAGVTLPQALRRLKSAAIRSARRSARTSNPHAQTAVTAGASLRIAAARRRGSDRTTTTLGCVCSSDAGTRGDRAGRRRAHDPGFGRRRARAAPRRASQDRADAHRHRKRRHCLPDRHRTGRRSRAVWRAPASPDAFGRQGGAGSLNPTCPLRPIPTRRRSRPPARRSADRRRTPPLRRAARRGNGSRGRRIDVVEEVPAHVRCE